MYISLIATLVFALIIFRVDKKAIHSYGVSRSKRKLTKKEKKQLKELNKQNNVTLVKEEKQLQETPKEEVVIVEKKSPKKEKKA